MKLENGEWIFDVERVARSLGFTEVKNGKEYVRWRRVNQYLKPFGTNTENKNSPQVEKGDFIPEAAVYKLAFKANNEVAEKFQDWLAAEVLPQIRKTGGYVPTSNEDDDASIMAKAFLIAQKTITEKENLLKKQAKELEGKNRFINGVAVSKNSLKVEEVAAIACKNGIRIGRNRLWQKLREWSFIKQTSKYYPKQRYIDNGYFEVVEGVKETSKGIFVYTTTRVTGKGQIYIINKLQKELAKAEVAATKED